MHQNELPFLASTAAGHVTPSVEALLCPRAAAAAARATVSGSSSRGVSVLVLTTLIVTVKAQAATMTEESAMTVRAVFP